MLFHPNLTEAYLLIHYLAPKSVQVNESYKVKLTKSRLKPREYAGNLQRFVPEIKHLHFSHLFFKIISNLFELLRLTNKNENLHFDNYIYINCFN